MALHRLMGEDQGLLQEGGEVGGAGHGPGQTGEEAARLPGDDLPHQLLAPAREVAVDGRPRQPRGPGRVLDGGLGQPVAGHAGEGGLEDPLAHVVGHALSTLQGQVASLWPAKRSQPSTARCLSSS